MRTADEQPLYQCSQPQNKLHCPLFYSSRAFATGEVFLIPLPTLRRQTESSQGGADTGSAGGSITPTTGTGFGIDQRSGRRVGVITLCMNFDKSNFRGYQPNTVRPLAGLKAKRSVALPQGVLPGSGLV